MHQRAECVDSADGQSADRTHLSLELGGGVQVTDHCAPSHVLRQRGNRAGGLPTDLSNNTLCSASPSTWRPVIAISSWTTTWTRTSRKATTCRFSSADTRAISTTKHSPTGRWHSISPKSNEGK